MNNVQRCLCHFYTWMRHSKQTATLLLTKRHANFDTSTSAKGYARVCMNCACAIVVLGILLAQARPTMPCIRLVIGASAASPTLVVKTENCLYIYLFIYIYIWYVRIPYMHSALFVRDAIFPHCICITACSRDKTRKAEQWESTQQRFENGEEREALLVRPRLIIDGVLRDSATSGECSVYRAISL